MTYLSRKQSHLVATLVATNRDPCWFFRVLSSMDRCGLFFEIGWVVIGATPIYVMRNVSRKNWPAELSFKHFPVFKDRFLRTILIEDSASTISAVIEPG